MHFAAMLLIWVLNLILHLGFMLLLPLLYVVLLLFKYQSVLYPSSAVKGKSILIHAASVGEVNAVKELVIALQARYPDNGIVITTNTVTGLETAQKAFPQLLCTLAAPDLLYYRYMQLRRLNPALICIVETEIWPNLLLAAKLRKVPIMFLNARLSQKSIKRLRIIKPILRYLEEPIVKICAQSEDHVKAFAHIFCSPAINCGNLKFAATFADYELETIRREYGCSENDFVISFGSSRPGEELLMLKCFRELQPKIPHLRMIIALRHPKRMSELTAELAGTAYSIQSSGSEVQALHFIDVLGSLLKAYSICDLAIVGGSFYDFGGHNPLEPAYFAKAIIMGKYYSSCKDSVNALVQNRAICLTDAVHLSEQIYRLFLDAKQRLEMGKRAKAVLTQNAHSLQMHLDEIEKLMRNAHA